MPQILMTAQDFDMSIPSTSIRRINEFVDIGNCPLAKAAKRHFKAYDIKVGTLDIYQGNNPIARLKSPFGSQDYVTLKAEFRAGRTEPHVIEIELV